MDFLNYSNKSKFKEVYEGHIGNIVMNNWLVSK